jgi:hypothetical protein
MLTHSHTIFRLYPRLQKCLQGLTFLLATPLLLGSSYWIHRQATQPQPQQVTLRLNQDDHYIGQGSVNGLQINFLLDTGATQVAISSELADQLGLTYGDAQTVETANGNTQVYPTLLNHLRIGNIQLQNVIAYISPQLHSNDILLGMNVLKTLDLRQQDQQLTLIQQQPSNPPIDG